MSDLHSETTTPRTRDGKGAVAGPSNDGEALNGGSMKHLYRRGTSEVNRPTMAGARVAIGVGIFGGLFIALGLMAGFA